MSQKKFLSIAATIVTFIPALAPMPANANAIDWSPGRVIPPGGISNPYHSTENEFAKDVDQGKIHAQIYPVEITGALPPYQPLVQVMEGGSNPLRALLENLLGIRTPDDLLGLLGMHFYPQTSDSGVYSVPYPQGTRPTTRLGFGLIRTADGTGFSLSCAECHSANLFGKTVLGMTNRFPRANEFFLAAKRALPLVSADMLKNFGDATDGEVRMFQRLQENLKSVGTKNPATLGLDTSLAQVALSLARRNQDPYATRSDDAAMHPRPDPLDTAPADSKPAVWWNVKFKNRFLSDGSMISGSPILTNILWNEIGRGGDLVQLEDWLKRNESTIRELTSAVFSSEAPRFTDFFPAEGISLDQAKRGEIVFNAHCTACHGSYQKAWKQPGSEALPASELLKTTLVTYLPQTPVVDVGTDPGRYLGMTSLQGALNPLEISQKNGITVQAQRGYVPPPLVGIWARWPYFHNNSAPTLCAVLSRHEDRPVQYYAGEANDPATDFDSTCNGYPAEQPQWTVVYDTQQEGLSNQGHDEGIFLRNGKELLTPAQKSDLVVYLQTL